MNVKLIGITFVSVLFVAACSASIYIPTGKIARESGIPLGQLLQGRELYVEKCSSCHSLVNPARLTAKQWNRKLRVMAKRAKLTEKEKQLITNYLIAGSETE